MKSNTRDLRCFAVLTLAVIILGYANASTSEPSLHKAVEQDDIALVKSLLQKGANVNEPDSLGWSPLHFAAYKGYKQIAEVLLNNGAIVNAKANNDVKPLHLAAEQGQIALAELLLGKGADVNARQVQGWTPLGLAAGNCHLETVKLLLDKGADVNSKSKSGLTPLHTAVSKGCREVVELLLSKGAKVNAKSNNGRTPLHTAAYQNQQEVAKLLLSAGADPNIKDIEGKTPVDFATDFGNVTMAKLLTTTTESHPVGEQPKTSADLPTDGVYNKDVGSGGSYKDPIHGFFEVEPPKGFKIVENRDRNTITLDDGTVVPCSRISFQSDKARVAVITRKTFKGTIEEDSKIAVYNLRSAGAEIVTERFVTIDGSKGIEVGAIAGGYRLLIVKYKKHGLDHAITMSCSPADFPKHQKEFTDFLRSYRSLKSEQDVKRADGERSVVPLQQDDKKQVIELKKTESPKISLTGIFKPIGFAIAKSIPTYRLSTVHMSWTGSQRYALQEPTDPNDRFFIVVISTRSDCFIPSDIQYQALKKEKEAVKESIVSLERIRIYDPKRFQLILSNGQKLQGEMISDWASDSFGSTSSGFSLDKRKEFSKTVPPSDEIETIAVAWTLDINSCNLPVKVSIDDMVPITVPDQKFNAPRGR